MIMQCAEFYNETAMHSGENIGGSWWERAGLQEEAPSKLNCEGPIEWGKKDTIFRWEKKIF